MSKFKLNSEHSDSDKSYKKKHTSKRNRYDKEDFTDFAYMSRSSAKSELRYLKETYGL